MRKPRVLVLADIPQWAWGRRAREYQRHLSDEFEITVAYYSAIPCFTGFDLVHLIEFPQLRLLADYEPPWPFKVVCGGTAHVWLTWGSDKMRAWAEQCDAWHANSLLLRDELLQFHKRAHYLPNGVDAEFWCPVAEPQSAVGRQTVIAAHVGKPNQRKGGALIVEAARRAGVELRLVQRTSKMALPAEALREFYRGVDVQVTASNMDCTPNPALESAACGVAQLGTRIGNLPEFLEPGVNGFLLDVPMPRVAADGISGIYVPENGPWPEPLAARLTDQLAERLAWFRDHPQETREMGRQARLTIDREWTWEIQVEHVRNFWREVLG